MSNKKYILDFLENLNKNNSKEWMSANKETYNKAKEFWLIEVAEILKRLRQHDAHFEQFQPKDTVARINNNRMFNPDLPVYKDHFAFSPMTKNDGYSRIFFTFSPFSSFIGGGLYRPKKDVLEKVRAKIDQHGVTLKERIDNEDFVALFGGLAEDDQILKRVPRGFDKEHEYGDLLKRKNLSVSFKPTRESLLEGNLADIVEDAYLKMKPVNDFFHSALA